MGKDTLQSMVLGKLDSHMQKNETGQWYYTMHKKFTQNGLKTWI